MANTDPFSMLTMLNSLRQLRSTSATEVMNPVVSPPPRSIPISIPHPRDDGQPLISSFPGGVLTLPEPEEWCLQSMFNRMTKSEEEDDDSVPFRQMISTSDRRDLHEMASLLTSDSDYFLAIARNKNGSNRLQKLIGKSEDVDNLFCAAISRRFVYVMTDKHASYVAMRGMRVFDERKKRLMYDQILHHALNLARDRRGCITLNEIITDLDHPFYRYELLNIVTFNALMLSCDAYGNFVVQHVLRLNDLRCTYNIAVSLNDYCVELSFNKYGSYIVEKLLETDVSMVMVVEELLECQGDRLLRLARGEYGNFVVGKALQVTLDEIMIRPYLFCGLVNKLMRYIRLLRGSRGSNIAAFLESI